MIFEHTEEQSLLRDMVRDFAESKILPSAKERDENERFDRALKFDRLAHLSLGSNPTSLFFLFGSEQQKEQFLVPLATGAKKGAHGFPVERMVRDAEFTEIYERTSEIQRLVIGSSLTR